LHVDAMEEARLAAAAAKRSQHEIAPGQTKTQRAGSDQTDQGTQVAVGSAATSAATETDRLLHHVLNGYRLDKELGRGAMGAVYLARQLSLDRNVALKIIQARWAADPSFIARFTREAYAAAQLTHHNVVQVYDLGEDHDTNFFSMEFVNGQNLGEIIKQRGKIPPKEAVGYILQAARGLAFAHAHGLIHRDIKPDNLMLNGQGLVKVADLGLVKHIGAADEEAHLPADSKLLAASKAGATVASAAMGTPAYMPPEQAEDAASVDQRADIYALGCTLYALLTGRPPFQGTTAAEVLTKHKNEPIERPDAVVTGIASELADINLRMMAKRPEDRYSSMEQVVAALQAFLERSSTSGSRAVGRPSVIRTKS